MHLIKQQWFQKIMAFGISAVLLFLALRSVDISQALTHIGSFNPQVMLVGLIIWLIGYGVRASRWLIFLNNLATVRWYDSFRVLMAGFAMNNLLPLRAGEFVRAFLLHRVIPKISTSSAFATIAGERVFDGLAVVLVTYVGAYSLALPGWASQALQWSVVLFVAAFLSFLFLVLYPQKVQSVLKMISHRLPGEIGYRLDSIFERFIIGLAVLKSKRSIITLLVFSIVIWTIEVAFYYFSAMSFGIEISFLNACFLMGILNLAIMVPAGPGGVGTFEFVTVQSLLLFGVGESLSFGYGVVSHVVQNGSVIIIGLFYMWRMGLSVSEVQSKHENRN